MSGRPFGCCLIAPPRGCPSRQADGSRFPSSARPVEKFIFTRSAAVFFLPPSVNPLTTSDIGSGFRSASRNTTYQVFRAQVCHGENLFQRLRRRFLSESRGFRRPDQRLPSEPYQTRRPPVRRGEKYFASSFVGCFPKIRGCFLRESALFGSVR